MDPYAGLTSGTVLEGRYRLGGMIARGGMSTVYRGVDTRLDRPVAIKVMSPQFVSDPAFLRGLLGIAPYGAHRCVAGRRPAYRDEAFRVYLPESP